MHIAVGVICLFALAILLAEFFVVFLLPRRVKRDPAVARAILRILWLPWRAAARRLPHAASDTMLGIFGPLGLIAILGLLSVGVILTYSGLHWAASTHIGAAKPAGFGNDLYFSAGAFFSASTPAEPDAGLGKAMQVAEAATGFAFLAIAIGYLPALFQAFSRRETAVSRLDPRAGSPPSAAALLTNSAEHGGWPELDEYLHEWEAWTAELMETHLSYPILGYFRSQHLNQNWVAALTTVVDACAYAIAFGPDEDVVAAHLTFRIGRHALVDLAHAFISSRINRNVSTESDRLSREGLEELQGELEGSGLQVEHSDEAAQHLEKLRSTYEPYAVAISGQLALDLPNWLPENVQQNWRTAVHQDRRERLLP